MIHIAISLKKYAVVPKDWQQVMKIVSGSSNCGIHSAYATTTLVNHINKIAKLNFLLKVGIKKFLVLLRNRWCRELVNAVLTCKIGIFLLLCWWICDVSIFSNSCKGLSFCLYQICKYRKGSFLVHSVVVIFAVYDLRLLHVDSQTLVFTQIHI